MATRADVDRFAAANADIRRLATADLERWWTTVETPTGAAAREAAEEMLPRLVARYGEIAGTVAADWYDDLRARAVVARSGGGVVVSTVADGASEELVRRAARWSVGPMFQQTPDRDATVARLSRSVDRLALQQGRDTIALSVERDPASVRWARVPTGPETCAFCLMLASRGAEYRSRTSAGGDANAYHDSCDCVPTPIWDGDPYPDGYDPDVLYERYQEAVAQAGSGDPKAILSELRKLEGSH